MRTSAQLQSLAVVSRDLQTGCIEIIAPCTGRLHALSYLQIAAGNIGFVAANALLKNARSHIVLADLSVVVTGIDAVGTHEPLRWYKSIQELREVSFSGCELGPEGAKVLRSKWKTFRQLPGVKFARQYASKFRAE